MVKAIYILRINPFNPSSYRAIFVHQIANMNYLINALFKF